MPGKLEISWSWWDSNPRPNIFAISFLHAYSVIACRINAGVGKTNVNLSWMVLSDRHSLLSQHPFLF